MLTSGFSYGVTAGGEALASSVASAVEGVVVRRSCSLYRIDTTLRSVKTKPLEGAESAGALGFFRGVGVGLVG